MKNRGRGEGDKRSELRVYGLGIGFPVCTTWQLQHDLFVPTCRSCATTKAAACAANATARPTMVSTRDLHAKTARYLRLIFSTSIVQDRETASEIRKPNGALVLYIKTCRAIFDCIKIRDVVGLGLGGRRTRCEYGDITDSQHCHSTFSEQQQGKDTLLLTCMRGTVSARLQTLTSLSLLSVAANELDIVRPIYPQELNR